MPRLSWLRSSVIAATLPTAAAGCKGFSNPDRCFIQIATVVPISPVLNVGDTVTLRLVWNASTDCLPRDTTAKSLRWETLDRAIAIIDSVSARLTALSPGETVVDVGGRGGGGTYAEAFVRVSAGTATAASIP